MNQKEPVYFGFDTIDSEEKSARVSNVFDRVAHRYDIMNDISSFGLHRIWKHMAVDALKLSKHKKRKYRVIDVAAGTGDISRLISNRYGDGVELTVCDPNSDMLEVAKKRHATHAYAQNWHYVKAEAELLPFDDNSFDAVIISFGLRNCTDPQKAMAEFSRILRPMGRFVCLEFSMPEQAIITYLYDLYSFYYLPVLGSVIAGDAEPYQYLAESIRSFFPSDHIKQIMQKQGFSTPRHVSIEQGIVALYSAYNIKTVER